MSRIAIAIAGAVLLLGAGAGAEAPPGVVAGTVRLAGPRPVRPAREVFKHREVCGASVPDDRLVVDPAGGVRYAVVTVDGVRAGKKPERDAVHVLNNLACRFDPHVQVAEVGQWLEITNGDPVLHNADARMGSETLFNVAVIPGATVRRPLARPGLISIVCDVRHTWMSAFVLVTDHPYHTVTDVYGEYEIRDLPPGAYTLRVWHEELGTLERPLTVEAGKTASVDLTYPAAAPPREGTP